jgi:hypothetical protein
LAASKRPRRPWVAPVTSSSLNSRTSSKQAAIQPAAVEDGWGMVATNDQGMTWRNGPRIQNGDRIAVARQLRFEVMAKRASRSLHRCLRRPWVGDGKKLT